MFQVRAYEARTVTWWYQRRRDIDFNPPFQRSGKLWSPKDKSYLIDSIINEYDFPKIYLADFNYNQSKINLTDKKFAVIDGRQRLEAIFDFIENKFPLADNFVLEGQPELDLTGLRYSELRSVHPQIALVFEQFNIPVMSVITDDEAKINQLFVRMNRNKPLTGAEIRNAMKGAVPPAIRSVAAHQFFTDRCAFATNRGQDKNVAAKLLLLTQSNQFVNTKKVDLDSFVISFEESLSQASELEVAKTRTIQTLDKLSAEFDSNDPRLKASGLIPVYFKVAEEHGAEKLGDFLSFWNTLATAPSEALESADFLDEQLQSRIRLFNLLKRNVNDSYALHRLFVLMSVEFQRFRRGQLQASQDQLSRFRLRVRAAKNAKRKA